MLPGELGTKSGNSGQKEDGRREGGDLFNDNELDTLPRFIVK